MDSDIFQKRNCNARPGRVRPPQLAASFLTRSGAATHRSEASHPPPVSFLFWRGSGSGCTLFPSPHGIVAERLVRRARRAEEASRMTEWPTSRGLQAPKEVQ